MSNLVVTYEGLQSPPPSCAGGASASPEPCHFDIPLTEAEDPKAKARIVRFDLQGDHFVLSPKNSPDELTWVGRHANLGQILDTLSLAEENILSNKSVSAPAQYAMQLMIAQFVVTGAIRFPNQEDAPQESSALAAKAQLATRLLGSFAISDTNAIRNIGGALSVFRGQTSLPPEARKRIEWISSILDLLPAYHRFRRHFVGDKDHAAFNDLEGAKRGFTFDLLYRCWKAVIHQWMDLPLPYDKSFMDAFSAFQALKPATDDGVARRAFCARTEQATLQLRGKQDLSKQLLSECSSALGLKDLEVPKATLRSLEAPKPSEFKINQRRNEPWLPVMEGLACAFGAAGIGVAEGAPDIRASFDSRLGLGAPSALLLGSGCSALVGHFLFPRIAALRNPQLVEGITAGLGAALSLTTYLLATLIVGASSMHGTKNPTDVYGPLTQQPAVWGNTSKSAFEFRF